MLQIRRAALVLSAILVLSALPADAQYFGRNKVQWERFDFKVLRTEHFDIYYYGERSPAIDDAARMAERWNERLSVAFDHQLTERKPIVLYQNHADFQQTTTTSGMIGEGTGGFTDFFRNRVVMPLTGTYAETDHVLGHELVHVFQFDSAASMRQNRQGRQQQNRIESLPLWMVEGLAEYFTQGREDPQTAMMLRDAAITNRLPDYRTLMGDRRFSPYHYGQAFWAYVGGKWNDETVRRLFYTSGVIGIEEAFRRVLGMSTKDVFADWHATVRQTYDPMIAARTAPGAGADPLRATNTSVEAAADSAPTADRRGRPVIAGQSRRSSDLNVAPSVSPDGRFVAFLSSRELFSIDLFLADATTGQVINRLVSSQRDPHFEALRFVDSAGDWSPDGRKLAFVVFERGDNQIAIFDVNDRRVDKTIEAEGVSAITNPTWSPDGRTIAFSGATNGVTDLYLLDVESGQVRRLMNDAYADLEPSYSPDGRTIAFVTDRGAGTDLQLLTYSPVKIALYDVATGDVRVLPIFTGAKHISPHYAPDGRSLYFISDVEGVADVFRYTLDSGATTRITNVSTGVSGITELAPALSVASRTGRIMYSVFENNDWNIYGLDPATVKEVAVTTGAGRVGGLLPPARKVENPLVETYLDRPAAGLLPQTTEFPVKEYRPKLGIDYIGPPTIGVGTDRYGLGFSGSFTAIFGDILGQHQLGLTFQGEGGGVGGGSSANTIGGQLFYLNKEHRFNWGAVGAHIPYVSGFTTVEPGVVDIDGQSYQADIVRQYRETTTVDELSAITQYPLGVTRRWEASAGYSHIGYDAEVEEIIVIGGQIVDRNTSGIPDSTLPASLDFTRGSVAFVGDSSVFGFISPIAGTRYRYEVETLTGDLQFQTALADYRRYFLARPVTFAFRGMHFGRYGSDSESNQLSRLFLGRPTLVRGYEDFSASECTESAESSRCPEFDRLLGSKIAVANFEVRVPLFGFEGYGLIEMPYLPTELVGFVDAGTAWTEDDSPELKFDRDTIERVPVVSYGIAARVLLGGYLPLEFYWAVPQNREENSQYGFTISPGW